jgi:hypothetical protein
MGVFVGFSDNRRLVVVRLGIVAFVLVIIIVVGVSNGPAVSGRVRVIHWCASSGAYDRLLPLNSRLTIAQPRCCSPIISALG